MGKGPYMKSKKTTSSMMMHLVIALIPIVLFSFYKNGIVPFIHHKTDMYGLFYPLFFIGCATFSTFFFETVYAYVFLKKRNHELKEYIRHSYSFIPGLFLGLILPIHTPFSIVIFGAFMASIVGKMLFGGFGENIFNPALIGRLFIIVAYAAVINNHGGYLNGYELDTISKATPLSNVSTLNGIGTYAEVVKPYGSLWNFFFGTIPGAVGETSALLCLVGFLYLTFTRTIKWRIPVFYVGTVFLITMSLGFLNGQGLWYPLFAVMSGGLLFGATFMATDPVTSPMTSIGQILYGIALGILTVVFRYLTPYPEGVLTSILTMNLFVFILDRIGVQGKFSWKKVWGYFVFFFVLAIFVTGAIYKQYRVGDEKGDPNFHIIDSSKNGDNVIYTVTQKGYSGDIKASITILKGKVIQFEVVEVHDSFYQQIIDADYLKKLVDGQGNIENVDTVSGATITSNALKKMLVHTLEDYGENYE